MQRRLLKGLSGSGDSSRLSAVRTATARAEAAVMARAEARPVMARAEAAVMARAEVRPATARAEVRPAMVRAEVRPAMVRAEVRLVMARAEAAATVRATAETPDVVSILTERSKTRLHQARIPQEKTAEIITKTATTAGMSVFTRIKRIIQRIQRARLRLQRRTSTRSRHQHQRRLRSRRRSPALLCLKRSA